MSKSSRDERRAARVAAEREAAVATLRRRRAWRLAAAAGLAAILVAVAVAVSASGGNPPAANSEAAAVVKGIEEHDGVLGDPNAPVTITEYVDLQCPICAAASQETMPDFIDAYVRTGKVKLQVRTLSFLGPDSVRAAKVAAGAEQQGRLWSFVETL
jgi:protein-disulfide isomerase